MLTSCLAKNKRVKLYNNNQLKTIIMSSDKQAKIIIMEKPLLFFLFLFVFSVIGFVVFGADIKHTLQNYGLNPDATKYLSQSEIKEILDSKTPRETLRDLDYEKTTAPAFPGTFAANKLDGVVDCFDYYHFGSIQTTINSDRSTVAAGAEVKFSGIIENQNIYPIVNGTLYIKILRDRSQLKDINGPEVIDQFVAKDDIVIPAKSSVPVSFSWQSPSSSLTGTYKIASFFIVDKKFNLLGLSFTDDVIGNTTEFKINGQNTNVQFDKAGVTINGNAYHFAVYPPRIPSDDPSLVSAKLVNTTSKDQKVQITWNLYRWDSIDPDNFIRSTSSEVTVKAKSSQNVQITVKDNDSPVYYLVAELSYNDSKSILGIRFVRPEVDRIRLNFPSVMQFPLKSRTVSTMFSCLHNSGTNAVVPDGKLTIEVSDASNKIISQHTYTGPVTGDMMAVKKDFIPKTNLDHFFLSAQLWQGDKLVDQSKIEYDCKKIDPKLCNKENHLVLIILLIIVILFIILGFFVFLKKRMNKG